MKIFDAITKRNVSIIVHWFCAIVIVIMVLPYFINGDDMYITIMDNLEQMPTLFARSKFYGFFTLDAPSGVMDNTSSLYFGWGGFSVVNVLYHILPPYIAYVTIYISSVFIAFLSMRKLQMILFGKEYNPIVLCTSLFYSITATLSVWAISIAFIPIICIAFFHIYKKDKHSLLWAFLFFIFPFFSEFNGIGIFICCFLLLGAISASVKQKQINKLLFLAFLLYCCGTVCFHLKLFYLQFIVKEVLNRYQHEKVFDLDVLLSKEVLDKFLSFVFKGEYLVPTQVGLLAHYCIIYLCYLVGLKWIKKTELSKECRIGLVCVSTICIFSIISTLDFYACFNGVKNLFHPIKGFDFTRLYVFARLLWYVTITSLSIDAIKRFKYKRVSCVLIALLFAYQAKNVIMTPIPYNDSVRSIKQHLFGIGQSYASFTWEDFYDEELFNRIKIEINYQGEPVACVGISPMVLIYNNFNSIGGYLSYYPYQDMVKFRKLIQPELDANEISRYEFNKYNGRRILFNSMLNLQYCSTQEKHHQPIELNIDSSVFKDDFGGKYIFSRAPLSNNLELNLDFMGRWDSIEGVYSLYVYKIKKDNGDDR